MDKNRSGGKGKQTSDPNDRQVENYVEEDPKLSIRRRS